MCSQTRNSCAKAFDNQSRDKNLKPKKSRGGGQFDSPLRLLGLMELYGRSVHLNCLHTSEIWKCLTSRNMWPLTLFDIYVCTENNWQPDDLKSTTSEENGLSNSICAFCNWISITRTTIWTTFWGNRGFEWERKIRTHSWLHCHCGFLRSITGQTLMRTSN